MAERPRCPRMIAGKIVPGDRSGGATMSHTVVIPALETLLASVDRHAAAVERAVLAQNVLGRTPSVCRSEPRGTRESCTWSADSVPFRALRDLWTDGPIGPTVARLSTAILMSSLVAVGGPPWWPSKVLAVRS